MSRLAYDRGGAGEPLVLVHPLGADRRVWGPVLPLLADQRDVIAVDLPGFGDSPALTGSGRPDPAALAAAVAGLLTDLGIEPGRAHVAGNSLGGWVALELGLQRRVASVTAIAPAGLWGRPLAPKPEIARTLARFARPALGVALRPAALRRVALFGTVAHPERVPAADALALVRAYANASGFTAVNRAMRSGTFGELAAIGVPVTLVWPEHDRLIARLRDVPPGVRSIVLPDAGHVPMWDAPVAVADAILAGSSRAARQRAA